jgi:hypothetical protein
MEHFGQPVIDRNLTGLAALGFGKIYKTHF